MERLRVQAFEKLLPAAKDSPLMYIGINVQEHSERQMFVDKKMFVDICREILSLMQKQSTSCLSRIKARKTSCLHSGRNT